MRFTASEAVADPGGDAPINTPSAPQPNSNNTNHHDNVHPDEIALNDAESDDVDLDEVDLDTEEIDLAEADLDANSTEEIDASGTALEPEIPAYSRREPPAPKKVGPMIVIIAAHAVIILAALCIFCQKGQRSSGGGYDPDYDAALSQDYITEPNTSARGVEQVVRNLGLPCQILEIVKESPAAPEARVVLQKTTFASKQELCKEAEMAVVRVGNEVLRRDERVRSVYVEIRAYLISRNQSDSIIMVTFDRSKVNGTMKGMSPREVLQFFGATYHASLKEE
ncbi:MAG: hypothetical protein AB1696_03435 [Planctomycetota bacterium]